MGEYFDKLDKNTQNRIKVYAMSQLAEKQADTPQENTRILEEIRETTAKSVTENPDNLKEIIKASAVFSQTWRDIFTSQISPSGVKRTR